MDPLYINLERLKSLINKSAEIGAIEGTGLSRLALTDEDKLMRDTFKQWMENAGLEVRVDDFGNMYGIREGQTDLPPVLIGSHLDTQPKGGRFDGVLGVLSALEVIHVLNEHRLETLRPITVVNFTNEEGARFEPALLGSAGVAGVFGKEYVYGRQDRNGTTFEEELKRIGYKGEQNHRLKDIYAFIELHIEQGPILESEGISIGAVKGIQGVNWLEVEVRGESNHSSTTPMPMRKDALTAASKMIIAIEEIGRSFDFAFCTVGRINVAPNIVNCIPEQVVFSIDIRHFDNDQRIKLVQKIKSELFFIAKQHNISLKINEIWNDDSTHFHHSLVELICNSAQKYGYSVKKMISGAGHDSKNINRIAPTAMIFVPSVNGKSHTVSELTLDEDIERGANVLLDVVYQLANQTEPL